MNPNLNIGSGSCPNLVQNVRKPDHGQSKYNHIFYECALVHDYQVVNPSPDEITGMAIVKRAMRGSLPRARVVPLNNILRAVHLIPVFSQLGTKQIPKKYEHKLTLDDRQLFKQFYVNKFIDHHAFEILS